MNISLRLSYFVTTLLVLVLIGIFTSAANAQEDKNILEKAKDGTVNAAKKVGEGTKDVATKAADVTVDAAKATAKGTKKVAGATVEGTKKAYDKADDVVAEGAQDIVGGTKKVAGATKKGAVKAGKVTYKTGRKVTSRSKKIGKGTYHYSK